MKNQKIAKIFYAIADYLKMDKVSFKPQAYEKAAASLEALEESVEDIYKKGGTKALEEIPGVGKSIAESIEEYLKTGKIKTYDRLKQRRPLDLEALMGVEGLGPQKIKILYQKLGVSDVKSLEKAAKSHKIAPLFGFGEKTEKNVLEGIEFLKRSKGRFLLGEILPVIKDVCKQIEKLKGVEIVSFAGSTRRMKETIGDADILVVSKNPKVVMDFFVNMPGVVKIWSKGTTKSSVRMDQGFDIDIRVVPKKSYGSALQYFTGSKEHNIVTRKIAIDKGLKLSEYGLFRGSKMIAGASEKEIYHALGMEWIPPELRENQGEVEAAIRQGHSAEQFSPEFTAEGLSRSPQSKSNGLPKLIELKDVKGDLHCHSDWDGGENSLEELAKAAMELGYEYLGISDHTKFLRIEHGLNEQQLEQRNKAIDELNAKYKSKNQSKGKNFRLLKGAETNIMMDGSMDVKDEALKKLDFVIAGVHSGFKMNKIKMTERIIRAMENPNIDIISHPTGRILKKRDEYEIDFDAILKAAKETGTILEINANPWRLDLNDQNIRRAKLAGVQMIINSDTHEKSHLRLMEFGVFQARRGWAEKKDIINTLPLEGLLKYFNK